MFRPYPVVLLLLVWLPVSSGCSALPRPESGEKALLPEAGTAETQPGPASPPARTDSGRGIATQAESSRLPRAIGSGPATAGPIPGQLPIQNDVTLPRAPGGNQPWPAPGVSAEVKTFVSELEQSDSLAPEIRHEILAWLSQTPREYQPQLIRQYRALLAMGKTPGGNPGRPEGDSPRESSVTAASAAEATGAVVPATHEAPVAAKADSEADLVDALASLIAESRERAESREQKAEGGGQTSPSETVGKTGPAAEDAAPANGDAAWQGHVEAAIEALRRQHRGQEGAAENPEEEARLRLLYLLAGRREEACRPISSLDPKMQEFWSQEMFGLATLMSDDWIADRSNRLVESKRCLGEALMRLGESATLFVRNLAFVTEVQSYGCYTPFAAYEFSPGQKVLLYAEVDNYESRETARGHHTSLRSSYEIFDSRRQKIAEHQFETNEEYCRNPRRDFFTVCEFAIPEQLTPGKYELRLTVADLNGDKSGQSSITFHVGDRAAK